MVSVETGLILMLLLIAALFYTQCVIQLGAKLNAAYLFAFTVYFDMFGYFYKQFLPGDALLLLVALPLLPVMLAMLWKPGGSLLPRPVSRGGRGAAAYEPGAPLESGTVQVRRSVETGSGGSGGSGNGEPSGREPSGRDSGSVGPGSRRSGSRRLSSGGSGSGEPSSGESGCRGAGSVGSGSGESSSEEPCSRESRSGQLALGHISKELSWVGLGLWAVFFIYSLFTLAWSPVDSAGLKKEQILLIRGMIPALYTYILYRKYGKFSWSIVAFFGLVYAIVHLSFGVYTEEYPGRLTLPGSNPIFNARISLLTVAVCLWGRRIPLPLRLVALLAAGASALSTQSRGPLAAFVIAKVLVLLYISWKKRHACSQRMLRRLAACGIGLLVLSTAGLSLYGDSLAEQIQGSRFTVLFDKNSLEGDNNFIGRMVLQEGAIRLLEEHPMFGAGLGALSPPVARDFPHNVALEIAGEQGLTGLVLWLLAVGTGLWAARKSPVVCALLMQALGYAMISGDFGYNYEYVLLAVMALAFYRSAEKKGESQVEQDHVHPNGAFLRRGGESGRAAVPGTSL